MSTHAQLLYRRNISFWTTEKKTAAVILTLALVTIAAGAYLYFRDSGDKQADLSRLSPPNLVPDYWLLQYFGTSDINDPRIGGLNGDPDQDGLTNYQEYAYDTDPTNPDTSGNGIYDGADVAYGIDPTGKGKSVVQQKIESTLRQAGVDINQAEIRREFERDMNFDRVPDVPVYTEADLKIVASSPATAERYYQSTRKTFEFDNSEEMVSASQTLFEKASDETVKRFVDKAREVVDSLKSVDVPQDLVRLHLLYLRSYSLFLSMGVHAQRTLAATGAVDPVSFYPELQQLYSMQTDIEQARLEPTAKYQLPF